MSERPKEHDWKSCRGFKRFLVGSNPTLSAMHHMVHGSANILLRNMFYYVYVLKSIKDSKLYIGYTEDLKKRIKEHWGGKVLSTKTRMPVELVFYEAYRNKYDALRREKYLKTSKGKSTLKNMLREFFKKD